MQSNKKKGNKFEEEFSNMLSENGFWAHVVAPNPRDGSQPFDVMAGKNERIYTFDCKTVDGNTFPLSRIEENQEKAFQKLYQCGCYKNYFVFRTKDATYIREASTLVSLKRSGYKSISVADTMLFDEWVTYR